MTRFIFGLIFIIIIPVVIPKTIGKFQLKKDTKCICDSTTGYLDIYCGGQLRHSSKYHSENKKHCVEDAMYVCEGQDKGATLVDTCERQKRPCRIITSGPTCDPETVCDMQ